MFIVYEDIRLKKTSLVYYTDRMSCWGHMFASVLLGSHVMFKENGLHHSIVVSLTYFLTFLTFLRVYFLSIVVCVFCLLEFFGTNTCAF